MNILQKTYLLSVLLFLMVNIFYFQNTLAQPAKESSDFEVTEFQTSIIATLTGYNNQNYFSARSTPQERRLTADFLENTFEELHLKSLRHKYKMPNVNWLVDLLLAPYNGQNVYSILKSKEPSEKYVLLGAHYDSEPDTPGAIDNASGVAVTFALANLIRQQEHRNYNYIFVLFDQEEDDEVGSKAFSQFLKRSAFKIHSTHIIDSIGWGDSKVASFEVQVSDSLIGNIYKKTASKLNIPLKLIGGRGASDNKSFNLAGYHSAGFWDEELTPNIHKPSDTFKTVNFVRLRVATYFMFELLTNLENNHD